MRCTNCGAKTRPSDGRVTIKMNEVMFSVITDIGYCDSCKKGTVGFQVQVQPTVATAAQKDMETRGNA